jgi:DNA repair exonuclease SbcCD nuclease subunit
MMVRVAIRATRRIVTMLLKKYSQVHIVMATGNHDEASSAWLREMLAAMYADEPRLTVETSPDMYYLKEFGNVALYYHHGHKRKLKDIDSVLASKFREAFGRCEHSYAHLGHLHSSQVHESNLMIVEQHPTLASQDAYASHGGWCSKRSSKVVTYHRDFGKVAELTISPEMVK